MNEILSSQAFGIMLTMALYIFGHYLYRRTNFPLFNPLLFASILLIAYIKIGKVDVDTFLTDLSGINVFLGPLIVCLAVPIAKQIDLIKKNLVPIMVGSIVGATVSIVSVLLLGKAFGLEEEIIASIIPKSSTTPIAIEVSNRLGGIRAVTVAVVILTAVLGAVIVPIIIKVFKIKDPRIIGMGLGSTAHAVGTAKALEIDPIAGAISGIALVFVGVATALISLFL
jgi:predicted murein hydrolase (TIGR00659 family)